MARRAPVFAPPSGAPNLFSNPYAGQANAPVDQSQAFEALSQQYQQQYNKPGFATQHPVLTGLAGLALAGPAGAFALPVALKDKEQQKKAALLANFNQMVKDRLGNQKTVDEITQPLNQVADAQRIVNDANKLRPVDNQLSNFYPQNLPGMDGSANQARIPNLSREYVENRLKGTLAGSDSTYLQKAGMQFANNQYNAAAGIVGSGSTGTEQQEPGTLNANASQLNIQEPIVPPPYIANSDNVLNGLVSMGNNGLQEGQKRYQFDAEAPKRNAEVIKLLAEGKYAQAQALLAGAKTNTERLQPGLIKSQIGENQAGASLKNRTNPNLRSPSYAPLPTTASEQARIYREGGYGKPGTQAALLKYNEALTKGDKDYTQTSTEFDKDGKVIKITRTGRDTGRPGGRDPGKPVHGIPIE